MADERNAGIVASERRLRFLDALAAATQAITEPREIMQVTARMLGQHLGANRCAYAQVEEDQNHFDLIGDFNDGVSSIVGRYAFSDFGDEVLRLMRANRPYVNPDVDSDPQTKGTDLAAYRLTQIQAVICLPLHKAGRFVAAMAVHQKVARAWTADEIQLVQIVVARCWETLDRSRSERALREANQRLSLALEAGELGDWSWEAATDLVTLSDRASDIFSLPKHTPVTWSVMRDVLHGDDRERARIAVEKAIADRSVYRIEYRVLSADGSLRWVLAQGAGTYSDETPTGMIGIVQDITGRRLIEENERAARESEEFLNRVGRSLAAELDEERLIQLITDETTRATGAQFGAYFWNVVNERGESYTLYVLSGAPRAAFEKFPLPRKTAIFAPTFDGTGVVRIHDVKKDSRYGKNTPFNGMPKGHLPVSSYLAVPVISRSGVVLGGLFFGHEKPGVFDARHERLAVGIASQAAIALDNARLYRAAKEADRRKDEFLAMLAHELRNPLTPIVTALHMQKLKPDTETVQRTAKVIDRQIERIVRIVDDLLDVSRITRGKIQLRPERLDLREVVERSVAASRPLIEARNQSLVLKISDEPLTLDADPVRLEQILSNLLHNAAKYTGLGGRIEVTAEAIGKEASVSVKDSGIGIAPEFLSQVFDLFAQADRSLDRSEGGLGIGLTLARSLVEFHRGRIEAKSEGIGKGSEFIVRFPIAATPSVPLGPARPARSASGAKSIVVIEDSRDIADTTQMFLEALGHTVRCASNGPEGIELVRSVRPDVVLLDIGLPGMDGYQVAQRLRRDPETASVRIIAISGYAQEADRERARAAGVDAHLAKPVVPDDLAALL